MTDVKNLRLAQVRKMMQWLDEKLEEGDSSVTDAIVQHQRQCWIDTVRACESPNPGSDETINNLHRKLVNILLECL